MKFLIILLVFLGTQSSAFSTLTPSQQQVAIDNQRFFDILSGISSVINQLIESGKRALDNFCNQTQNLIENEASIIENAYTNGINAFNEYVAQVQAEADQIQPCIEDIPEKIQNVREETRAAIKKCLENGRAQLQSIRDDIDNYRKINHEAIAGVQTFIEECVNRPSFGDKIKCAVDASRNISATVEVFRDNIENTKNIVVQKIREASASTHECIAQQIMNGQTKIKEILEEARQCLDDAKSTVQDQSTTVDPTTEAPATDDPTTATNDETNEPDSDFEQSGQSFKLFV